ncbi:hypothetical protein SLS63_011853 [Diaporthe eres]|uniref:Ankyrin repeat protein n=1 Tax=Diaporthe eres TaxID=83184 RepID=A0ABR1NSZ1_DIAER
MENFAFRVEAHVTGMHVAAYFGLSALVLKAIRHGRRVDKDARTRSEESVVHWAVRWHQHEFLEILIFSLRADAGAKDSKKRTPLHIAVANEDLRSVEVLLKCRPDERPDLEVSDDGGWTVLRYAAAHGSRVMVEKLVAEGAQVNNADDNGWTALRWAADRDYVRICEILIHRKASMELELPKPERKFVQMADSEKRTALHYAAARGNLDVAKILVSWFNTGEVYTGKIYFGEVEDPLGNMISNIMGTCVLPYEEKGMSATTMLANIQVQTTFNITHKAIDTIMHDLTTNLAPRMSDLLSPSRNISETFGRAARLMSYHMRETADAGSVAKGETRQWVTYIRVRWAYMSFPIALAAAVAVFAAGVTTQSWRLGLNDVKGDAVSAMLLVDGHTRDVLRVEPRGARRDVVVLKTPLRLARDEKGLCLKSRMAALPTGSAGKSTHGAAAVGQV